MNVLFDLIPVILFFAAYKLAGIFVATGVAIASSVAQIAWRMARGQKVDAMMWLTLALVTIFGGATLISHNETFIKWKVSVLYWAYALALLVAEWWFGKNLIRVLFSRQLALPDHVWRHLNRSWAIFFGLVGCLNLYIAYHFSTNDWVNFKLFGTTGLMLVFVLVQAVIVGRYLEDEPND